MKSFVNQQKVNARAQLSNIASVGGLILLLVSVVMPLFLPSWAKTAYVLMFVGLGTAMVGIYFANRWVRKPRPEESLASPLKSLNDQYRLYNYPSLPCDHVLLTPSGLVILEVINLAGSFSYRNGKWREAMTIGRALRYIVEEQVGNPIHSTGRIEEELQELLSKELGADVVIPIRSIVVFAHPLVRLDIENAPIPVCRVDKLRKQITRKLPRLAPEVYEKLSLFLEGRTI
jgi:hypothetical protein